MKAMIQQRFGPPSEVLSMAEIDTPTIGDEDVLVRNRASSANPYDWHFIKGEPLFSRVAGVGARKPKHAVQGGDLAGTVEAVGSNVIAFKPGDEVYGFVHGSFAEYVNCPPDRIALKPSNLSFEEAATVPLAAITALQGLRDRGQVGAGQHVMIVGASGGVGHFAVQIAKSYGVEVTGVCSTANVDMVRELGADHVIDYATGDITSGERRFDVVFQLGGTDSASALRRVMKRDGTLVLCAGDGGRWFGPIGNMLKAMLTNPFVSQRTTVLLAKERTEDLDVIRGLVESGTIRPVISKTYQFEQTGEAVELVEVGRPQGKVAISIS